MALPVYAKSLFQLMKHLGWDQQRIAKRLGVSKTACSFWANGQRPISKRYEEAFLDLVMAELRGEVSRIGGDAARVEALFGYLEAWLREMYIKVGFFQRTLQEQFARLQSPLAKVDPLEMSLSERHAIQYACRRIVQLLDLLDSFGKPVMKPTLDTTKDPVEFFYLTRQIYREGPSTEE